MQSTRTTFQRPRSVVETAASLAETSLFGTVRHAHFLALIKQTLKSNRPSYGREAAPAHQL